MIAELLRDIDRDTELHFWEVLAHNLTVTIRAVWSDPLLSDADKVSQIKWINELLHHVTAGVYTFRLRSYEWPAVDFDREIERLSKLCEAVRPHLRAAVEFTSRSVLSRG